MSRGSGPTSLATASEQGAQRSNLRPSTAQGNLCCLIVWCVCQEHAPKFSQPRPPEHSCCTPRAAWSHPATRRTTLQCAQRSHPAGDLNMISIVHSPVRSKDDYCCHCCARFVMYQQQSLEQKHNHGKLRWIGSQNIGNHMCKQFWRLVWWISNNGAPSRTTMFEQTL